MKFIDNCIFQHALLIFQRMKAARTDRCHAPAICLADDLR